MRLHRAFTALLCAVALAACEKNAVRDLTGPLPSAGIRFFNFAVNAPSVHFYAGDMKLSATRSTTCSGAANPPVTANDSTCLEEGIQSTAGIAFGGVSSGRRYTGIEAGQYTFAGRVTDTTRADYNVAISTAAATLEEGKFYSYFQSGFYNATTQSAEAFIVEDDFSNEINWNVSSVRLVNAVSNAPSLTLYATNVETDQEYTIGGSVAYANAGAFTDLPPGTYDLRARADGATTDAYTRTNVIFEPGRVYTISTRGDYTSTSTTAAARRFLDSTINR